MASSWIHCNVCSVVSGSSQNTMFLLTSCGHLCCSSCSDKRGKEVCCVCGKKCGKVVLSQPLPAEVAPWVTDPLPSLRRLKEAFKFQTAQYNSLMDSQLRKYTVYYEELVKKKRFLESHKKQLKIEIMKKMSQMHNSSVKCTSRPSSSRSTSRPTSSNTSRPTSNNITSRPATSTVYHHHMVPATPLMTTSRQITLQTPASMRLGMNRPTHSYI